jgi:hypothetical protein
MLVSGLFAYIDPMSGSILLQVLVATLLSVAAFCYRPLGRFFAWLAGRKVEPQPSRPAETDEMKKAA